MLEINESITKECSCADVGKDDSELGHDGTNIVGFQHCMHPMQTGQPL